jgi:DHA1 family bicyclomycin/chloramphenicol resistance-like MFS transporter
MYLPSFPQIAADFGVEISTVQLSLATFFVGLALGQLLYGSVTDRFGRKRPLYVGLVVYFLASIGCALTPSVEALIVLRFFQALGACGGIVIARAAVRDLFETSESARVFSLLMLVIGVAPILAPLFGGYVALAFGWHAIFYVVAGFSALVLLAIYKFFPETRQPNPDIKLSRTFGTYLNVLRDREFVGFTFSGGFALAGMFAYITGSPFVFIDLFKIPAESYGWIFGSNAIGLVVMSQLNGRLLKRFTPTQLLRVGFALNAVFSVFLIAAGLLHLSFWGVAIPVFLYIASLGMIFPNATAGAMSNQHENAGSASALLGSLQYGMSALVSSAVSYFANGTSIPMAALIGGCGLAAFVIFNLLIRKTDRVDAPLGSDIHESVPI